MPPRRELKERTYRVKHSPGCKQQTRQYKIAIRAYARRWPNWCWTCRGLGTTTWTENGAPHGEGYWPMSMTDLCEDCTGQGLCPRCKKYNGEDWDKDTPCARCGWNWGKGRGDVAPQEPECFCDHEELMKIAPGGIYAELREASLGQKKEEPDGRKNRPDEHGPKRKPTPSISTRGPRDAGIRPDPCQGKRTGA